MSCLRRPPDGLVEQHAQECIVCGARLRRMQRLTLGLDVDLQACLNRAERLTREHQAVRPPPAVLLEDARSGGWLSPFSSVGVVLVLALLIGWVVLRSAPRGLSVQTAAQPDVQTITGPVVAVNIDGLVDPPTAQYVHRAIDTARQQHAAVLLSLAPSDGLSGSMSEVETDLAAAAVPTYVYMRAAPNATSATLAEATNGQRLVVFRLGKCIGSRGPGPVWLIPLVDRPVLVDQRELFLEVPHQSCITQDNVPIMVDFLIYRQVLDAVASVVAVQNFVGASQGIAATTLRAVIGDIALDDVLAERERINSVLREKLDEVTERWGVKVTAVEIREIVPPKDVQDAMNRQASVTVAEGENRQPCCVPRGDKQSSILKAEGYAQAPQAVFAAAQGVDSKTMTLQVIDGLKAIGSSPSSTFVIPMEFTKLFGQIGNYLEHSGLRGANGVSNGPHEQLNRS